MKIELLTFNEFSLQTLYDVLQLRAEVFVVEQNCPYQDVDGKDQKALHVLGFTNDKLVAYTRIFKPGDYFERASIGRVIVKENHRKYGYGKDIMNASIQVLEDRFDAEEIELSAQVYLKKFYNDLGFKEFGEGYLEDNIPHIRMLRN
ncbi:MULTISPECIES: GNAT family N-acetyltransferase [unclassified Leeuwenhoekiella]|uniref:GNAT family N-acetyltransferase n=1 Tax=unclassified Leeuwenhoekiella TaxID=2615029 RepID=UPI000C4456B3|nr:MULTISPECIES: GNAT family N-acetyltransferase [unclassified Leeuwenhoekiella]MAW95981.1 GNAT family N-acetyltransferase [Leeuwenhoekiella sp.]MBA79975.1 GNAT family N-acetyltransferase [Leeuwenhoekiella sp.]|tara:strand:+ start:27998 stop:28438 length:441 start_codon:yes stop_codon:yes gene_type:complete